jgi:hypothetical protein
MKARLASLQYHGGIYGITGSIDYGATNKENCSVIIIYNYK